MHKQQTGRLWVFNAEVIKRGELGIRSHEVKNWDQGRLTHGSRENAEKNIKM
jgi:hypothetical protein